VVSGAYVREPANGVNAAAYFTIYNTTGTPDVLTAISSGAGAQTSLHTESSGGMQHSTGLSIPAHGSATLSPGKGHVMIEKLYGPLKPGQSVNFQLTFAKSGQLLLTAPVIAVAAPAPTAEAP
jgi:copper(I)-binding protein